MVQRPPEAQVRWREGVSGGGNDRGKCAGAARALWGAVRDVKKWGPEDQGAELRAEAGWLRRASAVVNAGQMPCWSGVPAPCRCRCCCQLTPVPFLGALPLADGSCLTQRCSEGGSQ